MKKPLLFILLFIFSVSPINSQPIQLNNFEELMSALINGNDIRLVIHYSKCKLMVDGKEENGPDIIGGMEIKSFEYFAAKTIGNEKAFLASSETLLIHHSRYGYVFNYVKIRIFENNQTEVFARYLDPVSYEVKMDDVFYSEINNGKNEGGLFCYSKFK
jgi:hypothetical protein